MTDVFALFVFALVLMEVMGGILLIGWLVQARHHNGLAWWGMGHALAAMLLALSWSAAPAAGAYFFGSGLVVVSLILVAVVPGTIYLMIRMLRAEAQTYGAKRKQDAAQFLARLDPIRLERLEQDLKMAIEQPEGQLSLQYQPIFHTKTRTLVGFEALLRWEHPQLGAISPEEFINLAEKSGLILPLGKWVLETACAQAARWPKPWMVSVNVSPVQLMKKRYVKHVKEALSHVSLEPSRLQLEITESVLIDTNNQARDIVVQLVEAGVTIAVDDFGTGYSHLRFLNRIPCRAIKIDRSFIADLEHDTSAQVVTAAVIRLAHELGLDVVAEGVETEGQINVLASLGCQKVQGYLLGRPMDASDAHTAFAEDDLYVAGRAQGRNEEALSTGALPAPALA